MNQAAFSARRYRVPKGAPTKTYWVEHPDGGGHWASNWEISPLSEQGRSPLDGADTTRRDAAGSAERFDSAAPCSESGTVIAQSGQNGPTDGGHQSSLPGSRMQLACRHWISWPESADRRGDGWYAAQPCPHCGRKRSVVCASFTKAKGEPLAF